MIYLDNNSTTQPHPEVVDVINNFLNDYWANPSSTYSFGSKLKSNIENARKSIADLLNVSHLDVFFTSCATESNNTALFSGVHSDHSKKHLVTTRVEHSSVLSYCKHLESTGYSVTYLDVDSAGMLDLAKLDESITADTALVSVMLANNETGVLFPVEEISAICGKKKVLFHCDVVQAIGKIPVDVSKLNADYVSLSGHKFHGPKGVGVFYKKRKAPFTPLIIGGHQERGRRGGTENVPYIVAMGKAAELASKGLGKYNGVTQLRDLLEKLITSIPGCTVNGATSPRLPNTSSISFDEIESEAMLLLLDRVGIFASSGSACLADSDEPSHVLTAMNPTSQRNAVRFSLCSNTTEGEIKKVAEEVGNALKILRGR